jgi:DNA-nicking Smr family endonuclease
MSKKNEPFHNPFGNLKLKATAPTAAKNAAPAAVARASKEKSKSADEDRELFLSMVGEVQTLKKPTKQIFEREAGHSEVRVSNDESESLAQLAQLVSQEGAFDVSNSNDFIEAFVPSFDANVMQRLRKGQFQIDSEIDLHGLTSEVAKKKLEEFLLKCRENKRRCVLVITGKGLHSADSIPVLKQGIQLWLTRGRMAQWVLGFTSAQPKDGGTGAVYVLLKKAG